MPTVDGPTLEQGRERASDLHAALEQVKATQGRYPPDLETLVPDYRDEIPRPAWRYGYVYRQCASGEGYVLSFKEAKIPDGICACSSGSGEWKCSADLPWNWQASCDW
jgi:hypothetical protein